MQVARDTKGGHALVALSVDSAIPAEVLDEIRTADGRRVGAGGRPHRVRLCLPARPRRPPGRRGLVVGTGQAGTCSSDSVLPQQ